MMTQDEIEKIVKNSNYRVTSACVLNLHPEDRKLADKVYILTTIRWDEKDQRHMRRIKSHMIQDDVQKQLPDDMKISLMFFEDFT